jgi:branched-chain amino acid transport system substrate-binding protein
VTIKRRDFLKTSLSGAAALSAGSLVWPRVSEAADTIRVGGMHNLTGPFQAFGTNKLRCVQLALEEINKAGGLLGKQVELVGYDAQADNKLYAQYAQQLGLRDKVVTVFGGLTSSSREVVRPIFKRTRTLYFYNMPYEGGVCDRNIFCTGTTPGQLLANLIPHMVKKHGKKIYVLAADYNFGQISAKWTKKIAQEHGAQVIQVDYFPLDVNQFGPTISKIQAAKPDFIVNTFVGPAHGAFYGQWAAAGMNKEIPIASQTFGEAGEHLRMPTELSDGITVCYSYVDEIDLPTNAAFLGRFRAKFGDKYGYLGDLAVSSYLGVLIWAKGVKKAGSTDRDKVIAALESGVSIDGPNGKITVQPETHHCVFDMYLAQMKNRKFDILQTFKQVTPTNPQGVCNLIKNPQTNKQFEPKI